jgi:NAD(P)H-flavin reductase
VNITPLALLSSFSYERLNTLHQVGGYATIAYAFLHMTLMCTSFYRMHNIRIVLTHSQINGMIAVSSLFVILITAIFVRRMRYETFYFTHILMYMLVIVNIGMHRPSYALKVAIITTFAGSIWASDRIIRGCRLLLYFRHNSATITALSHGGTRVVLHCHPSRAIPGTHCFLWIPQIKWIETHPFTIASATPESLEFVVAAHDGFTKELYHYAQLHPGAKLRASVDGPYGVLPPSMHNADKLVMIAGGSGASFTFGVALDTIRELGESRKTSVEFIWTVKEYGTSKYEGFDLVPDYNIESFSWFANELAELQASPIVTLRLYTTSSATPRGNIAVIESLPTPGPVVSSNDEGQPHRSKSVPPTTVKHDSPVDLEKAPTLTSSDTLTETVAQRTPFASTATLNTVSGRPDVRTIIKDIVSKAQDIDRIVIAACGPPGLMTAVRSTTANLIQGQGPRIEMYCETFGW